VTRRLHRANGPFPGRAGPGTHLRYAEPFSACGLVEGCRWRSGPEMRGRHSHRLGRLLRSGTRESTIQRGTTPGRHRDMQPQMNEIAFMECAGCTISFGPKMCNSAVSSGRQTALLVAKFAPIAGHGRPRRNWSQRCLPREQERISTLHLRYQWRARDPTAHGALSYRATSPAHRQ
jgi:hypothetical protein